MDEFSESDPQELAKSIARSRRFYDRLWLSLTVITAIIGFLEWIFTRQIEALYTGLLAVFPLIGLIRNHFFLFNPRRDPAATKKHLEAVAARQQKNARTASRWNGTLLMLFSPVVLAVGCAIGWVDYGPLGGIVGSVLGAFGFALGLGMVVWGEREEM